MRLLTIIESPYAGDVHANLVYARAALSDSILRGEVPFASHLLYPQVLCDEDPSMRQQGMALGFAYFSVAERVAAYADRGISSGMQAGIDLARRYGIPVEIRSLSTLSRNGQKIVN